MKQPRIHEETVHGPLIALYRPESRESWKVSLGGILQIFTKPRLGRELGGSRLLITPKGKPGNRRYGLTIPSP
jgi:hypothetical protein